MHPTTWTERNQWLNQKSRNLAWLEILYCANVMCTSLVSRGLTGTMFCRKHDTRRKTSFCSYLHTGYISLPRARCRREGNAYCSVVGLTFSIDLIASELVRAPLCQLRVMRVRFPALSLGLLRWALTWNKLEHQLSKFQYPCDLSQWPK
jgi:hypothetical protein